MASLGPGGVSMATSKSGAGAWERRASSDVLMRRVNPRPEPAGFLVYSPGE